MGVLTPKLTSRKEVEKHPNIHITYRHVALNTTTINILVVQYIIYR